MADDARALDDEEREKLLSSLRKTIPADQVRTWCAPLAFHRVGQALQVTVPNRFYRDWIEKHLQAPLEQAARELGPGLSLRLEIGRAPSPAPPAPEPAPARPPRIESPAPARPAGYAEANFSRLPFALVNDKEIHRAREILIDITARSPAGMRRRRWRVTPGASGMPGPFDHAVFRALERHALDLTLRRGLPLRGPVFFHLKTIVRMLGLYYNSKNIRFISHAFDRLQEISIEDVDFLRRAPGRSRNPKSRGRRGKIHLVDRIRAAGEALRDGATMAVSGTYAVTFGREYEDSVNAGYVRPLDWDLWVDLARPISRRLVEILDMDFYGLRHGPHVAYEYLELCPLIPVKPQRFLSLARNVLDAAHGELASRGYLTWSWDTANPRFWRILYKPGPRWHAFQLQLGHGAAVSDEARNLARELGEDRRAAFYQQILDRVDPGYVNEAIQDLRAAGRAGRTVENRAAWFLGALKKILGDRGLSLFPLV